MTAKFVAKGRKRRRHQRCQQREISKPPGHIAKEKNSTSRGALDRPPTRAEEAAHADKQKDAAADHQSLLDSIVHKTLDPVLSRITKNATTKEAFEDGTKNFLKVAPLFAAGKLKVAGTVAAYVADEVKQSDHGSTAGVDAALGAAKAVSLLASQKFFASRNTTPSLMGVEMGIINRATDIGLTRDNYYDNKGQFNLKQGLEKTAVATASSIPTDLSTFAAADAVWGRLYVRTRGAIHFNPVLTSALTASTFNVTTAAGAEVSQQIHDGHFDLASLVAKSASAGAVGFAAGGLAGLQRRSALSTGIVDGPGAINDARSTPFQTGEIVDAAQAALRNGTFISDRAIKSPNNLTFAGRVVQSDGSETPAIFRAPNGTSDFAHRQQAEIGAYGLSKMMDLPAGQFPVTVAKETFINGVKHTGFIQEMSGENLNSHFNQTPGETSKTPSIGDAIKQLRDNTELRQQLQSTWAERLAFGEWDNHSLNQMVTKDGKPKTFNIDLGDGFLPATTSLDHVPHPGLRRSYDPLNAGIYREIAGKKFESELTSSLNRFIETKDNAQGRNEIGQLGFTPQQVDGIIGKTRWLAEHEHLPSGNQSPTYRIMIKTAVKGHKLIKNYLGKAKPAEQPPTHPQFDG